MFFGCLSLNYVKAMFTSVTNANDVKDMLQEVSATGTFVKNKAATWNDSDIIPAGWKVEYAE